MHQWDLVAVVPGVEAEHWYMLYGHALIRDVFASTSATRRTAAALKNTTMCHFRKEISILHPSKELVDAADLRETGLELVHSARVLQHEAHLIIL